MKKKYAAILVSFVLLGMIGISIAQQCMQSTKLNALRIGTMVPDQNGVIHVTYAFVDASGNPATPPTAVESAVTKAVQQWNNFTSTTHVKFEPAAANTSATIQFKPSTDPNLTGYAPVITLTTTASTTTLVWKHGHKTVWTMVQLSLLTSCCVSGRTEITTASPRLTNYTRCLNSTSIPSRSPTKRRSG